VTLRDAGADIHWEAYVDLPQSHRRRPDDTIPPLLIFVVATAAMGLHVLAPLTRQFYIHISLTFYLYTYTSLSSTSIRHLVDTPHWPLLARLLLGPVLQQRHRLS